MTMGVRGQPGQVNTRRRTEPAKDRYDRAIVAVSSALVTMLSSAALSSRTRGAALAVFCTGTAATKILDGAQDGDKA